MQTILAMYRFAAIGTMAILAIVGLGLFDTWLDWYQIYGMTI